MSQTMVIAHKNRFIKYISLKNFLSYGEKEEHLELKPLNVFIGPNASGKSNLIEALRIFRAASQIDYEKSIAGVIDQRGSLSEWIWKGESTNRIVELQLYTNCDERLNFLIEYNLKFRESTKRSFEIFEESLFRRTKIHETSHTPKFDYYYQIGYPPSLATYIWRQQEKDYIWRKQKKEKIIFYFNSKPTPVHDLTLNKSILSQRIDPDSFPNVTYLAEQFSKILIYRAWDLEFDSLIRKPQSISKYPDFLLEDGSNLSLIISNLMKNIKTQELLENKIKQFYPLFIKLDYSHVGGIQILIEEKGLIEKIPVSRISDGLLRFLCLLSILCHPNPPSVICIEEPELNMHPDIIPTIAELLIEASSKTQIFVTTHSDILISALSNHPECVIVCERDENGTHLKRLKKKDLEKWLEKYKLGDLWLMNKIGGNP